MWICDLIYSNHPIFAQAMRIPTWLESHLHSGFVVNLKHKERWMHRQVSNQLWGPGFFVSNLVLPASGCSPVFSPAPPWQQLTPAGGFVSGVLWLMRGYGSTPTAETLMGKMWQSQTTKEKVIFHLCRTTHIIKVLDFTFKIQEL